MKNTVKILVACGSGVATSTVAQENVKDLLKEEGIPFEISTCTFSEIPSRQDNVDLILVTSKYNEALDKPLISVFGLISGINRKKIEEQIINECKKILEK